MTFKVLTLVEVIEALMRAEASSAGDFRVTKQVVEVDVPALVASHEALREACDELLRCEEIRTDGTDWAEEEERHIAFQFALREDQIRALSADLKRLETETGVAEVKTEWRARFNDRRDVIAALRAQLAECDALAAKAVQAANDHNRGWNDARTALTASEARTALLEKFVADLVRAADMGESPSDALLAAAADALHTKPAKAAT